jgi:hypothetical protein
MFGQPMGEGTGVDFELDYIVHLGKIIDSGSVRSELASKNGYEF